MSYYYLSCKATANCAELPDDLIAHIANHVKVIEDFIAFRAVCTSWQIAATKDNFDMFSTQVPLLMLGAKDDDFQEFYSLSKKKVSRIFLPEARGRECFPLGEWLCTMEDNTGELNLLHPFSRTQIQLPSLEDLMASKGLREKLFLSCIEKVALSANPSITSDYVLMINYHAGSNHLAFWQSGDLHWTYINKEIPDAAMSINYYKGHFYYVTCEGELWSFEVAGPNTPKPIVEPRLLYWPEDGIFGQCSVQFDIVELSDALLFVTRYADYTDDPEAGHKTFKFKVLELDVIKGELKEEVKTLGDSAIFVGLNSGACSVDSSKFTRIKPNHIYFIDDWFQKLYFTEDVGGKDKGVYNLENGKIESMYPELPLSRICQPTWVMPSLIM
ncbi:F-box protein like [Capsicum chacoense]